MDSASMVLKLTERQRENNLFGSTKLCFSPFARIDVYGFFHDTIVKGINTCNVSAGISSIRVVPLGDCICGARDVDFTKLTERSDSDIITQYFFAGSDSDEKRRNFIKDSLFVKDFGHEEGNVESKERRKVYDIDWDQHLAKVTEENMLENLPPLL